MVRIACARAEKEESKDKLSFLCTIANCVNLKIRLVEMVSNLKVCCFV